MDRDPAGKHVPGPKVPAHGVGEVVPGDRTGQRSAFPMVLGCATARVKFLSRPWAWASVPCTIRYDSSRGSSTPPAILPWDSGRSARPLGPGRLRATVRPRQLWQAPEYATATVGRIGDGRVLVALRRRRHNLLNGVTVGTRIDPDLLRHRSVQGGPECPDRAICRSCRAEWQRGSGSGPARGRPQTSHRAPPVTVPIRQSGLVLATTAPQGRVGRSRGNSSVSRRSRTPSSRTSCSTPAAGPAGARNDPSSVQSMATRPCERS